MKKSLPLIQEIYKNYMPPINVMNTVQILLEYVPSKDLAFLQTIVLTNTGALSRERKRHRRTSRAPISHVRGLYHQAWNLQPAEIEIFVDNTINCGSWYDLRIPILRKLMFAEVLYHEIGHHVQVLSNSKLTNKEVFADKHAVELSRMFFRQHYWFLRPFKLPIKVLSWFMKRLRLVELVEKHGRVEKR